MVFLALLSILMFALAAGLVARAVALPRMRTARALGQIEAYTFGDTAAKLLVDDRPGIPARLGGVIAPWLGIERLARLRKRLVSAGFYTTSVETYLGFYVLSGLAVTVLIAWFAIVTKASGAVLFLDVVVGFTLAWLLAPTMLVRRARMRLDEIDLAIPELVDLLLLGVESGMGFNGALRLGVSRVEGPLGDELRLVLRQQGLGATTAEALESFEERSDTDAVRAFVRTIVQGERLGVSIGQLMRTLAEEMRKHRKAVAEEKAAKMPIKILFPLVFMILPAMFIVVLTPAIANLVQGLSDF